MANATGHPETFEQATKKRYGAWAGQPSGIRFDVQRCAYEVFPYRGIHYQCLRMPGHGPAELYCKQHAKKVESQSGATPESESK